MCCDFCFIFTDLSFSVEDDAALRAKVEEALSVYDEYVKTKTGDEEGAEGQKAEAPKEASEEKKEEKA